jgi:hypothetical protein
LESSLIDAINAGVSEPAPGIDPAMDEEVSGTQADPLSGQVPQDE